MKKILLFILIMSINQLLIAQADKLSVKTIKLNNGLTVILNEDHIEPKVFGAVVVKVGSKNDPEGTTGMAHYFEHIMFKGTDRIGTTDYEKEKPYLDQIAALYDELATTPEDKRGEILSKINELSIIANGFAIPSEVDKLLKKYGGSNINAYTSYDQTVYHNTFPPNQIDKWLEIYAERFRSPVFRMFQAELETVYEERNMYADMMGSKAFEDVIKKVVKKHPYRNPIIGTVKDLKTPSINKMMQFYKQYYVPGNMALVLTGDFKADEILPLIEDTFGKLPKGEAPVFPVEKYKEEPFKGREFFSGRYLPVKAGAVIYRGIPAGHPDEVALSYCTKILSNESQTGLLDRLRVENKVMMAMGEKLSLNDEGIIGVLFVPKLLGSLKKTEAEAMSIINQLKSGDFSDDLLEALKINFVKNNAMLLENKESVGTLLTGLFASGRTWDDYVAATNKYQTITKQQIIDAANKYFTDNRFVFYNRTGFNGKADKIKKPGYKALPSQNIDKQSAFAEELSKMPNKEYTPSFIDFTKDLQYGDIKPNVHLVTGNNPVNGVFTLKIKFGYGKNKDKLIELVPEHFNELGTQNKSVSEFRRAMQKLGTSYYMTSGRTSLTMVLDGFDENFEETVKLLNEYFTGIKADDSQMSKMYQSIKERNKLERKDHNSLSAAHLNYLVMGETSGYKKRVSIKEIKSIKSQHIVNAFNTAAKHEITITYVGQIPFEEVKNITVRNFQFAENVLPADKTFYEIKSYDKDMVSVFNNKKANQTSTFFYVPGTAGSKDNILMAGFFNQYFGRGMSSIMFHEIRELRSLSYSPSAQYVFPNRLYSQFKGYLYGSLSTQADKTLEAVTLVDSLIKEMPQKPEIIEVLKESFKESINTSKPGFREIPSYSYSLIEQGYTEDFRKTQYNHIELLNMESINQFYNEFVKNKPIVYILSGNKKKMDINKLNIKSQEVKLKDILTE